MKRSLLTYIVMLFYLCHGIAQEPTDVDDLINDLQEEIPDTSRINILNKLADEHLYIDHQGILDYANHALELSEKIDYKKGIAESYNNLGTYYRVKGNYQRSIDYYFNALHIMEHIDYNTGIARCYNLIGILYFYLENYKSSLDYYKKALELNYEQKDRKWIAGNSNNIGMIYQKLGEYDKALDYYLKSLEMNIELGYENWIANNYGNIGSLYQELDNPMSLDYYKRRLQINEENKDTSGISISNQLIGSYFVSKNEFERSIPYLTKSLSLARAINSLNTISRSSKSLSEAYEALKDYEKAYRYEKIFKQYNDSLKIAENTEKITRLQMQYGYKKEKQIEELGYEKTKLMQTIVAIGLFFILLIFILIYNRQRSLSKEQDLLRQKLAIGNKLLVEELKFKEKMLQDHINYQMSKNEILSHTIERLNDLKSTIKPENKKVINDIIFEIQSGISDDTWEEFEVRFKEINVDFYNKLNELFPNLSANEKRLCAFLRLNMTTKEISSITNQSIKSIETARSRLRKKLKIDDSTQSLSDFLNDIPI